MAAIEPRVVTLPDGRTVRIRSAIADDAAAVLAFLREQAATTDQILSQPDEFPATVDDERRLIGGWASDPSALMLLAEAEGAILCTAAALPGHRRRIAHTATLGITVHKAWRGRGVGTAVMRTFVEWARGHARIEKLCLTVFDTNAAGRRLYEKLGFVVEGRLDGGAKLGDGRYVDEVVMGLWVKPRGGG